MKLTKQGLQNTTVIMLAPALAYLGPTLITQSLMRDYFFKTLFTSDKAEEIPHIKPQQMTTLFSAQAVREAIETMKNHKIQGMLYNSLGNSL